MRKDFRSCGSSFTRSWRHRNCFLISQKPNYSFSNLLNCGCWTKAFFLVFPWNLVLKFAVFLFPHKSFQQPFRACCKILFVCLGEGWKKTKEEEDCHSMKEIGWKRLIRTVPNVDINTTSVSFCRKQWNRSIFFIESFKDEKLWQVTHKLL